MIKKISKWHKGLENVMKQFVDIYKAKYGVRNGYTKCSHECHKMITKCKKNDRKHFLSIY